MTMDHISRGKERTRGSTKQLPIKKRTSSKSKAQIIYPNTDIDIDRLLEQVEPKVITKKGKYYLIIPHIKSSFIKLKFKGKSFFEHSFKNSDRVGDETLLKESFITELLKSYNKSYKANAKRRTNKYGGGNGENIDEINRKINEMKEKYGSLLSSNNIKIEYDESDIIFYTFLTLGGNINITNEKYEPATFSFNSKGVTITINKINLNTKKQSTLKFQDDDIKYPSENLKNFKMIVYNQFKNNKKIKKSKKGYNQILNLQKSIIVKGRNKKMKKTKNKKMKKTKNKKMKKRKIKQTKKRKIKQTKKRKKSLINIL